MTAVWLNILLFVNSVCLHILKAYCKCLSSLCGFTPSLTNPSRHDTQWLKCTVIWLDVNLHLFARAAKRKYWDGMPSTTEMSSLTVQNLKVENQPKCQCWFFLRAMRESSVPPLLPHQEDGHLLPVSTCGPLYSPSCVQTSSFYKIPVVALGPIFLTSFWLTYLGIDPISRKSHILREYRISFQHMNWVGWRHHSTLNEIHISNSLFVILKF